MKNLNSQSFFSFSLKMIVLFACSVVLFSSCNNDSDDDNDNSSCSAEGCFEFTVDGTDFSAQMTTGVLLEIGGDKVLTFANANGIDVTTLGQIVISVPSSLNLGTQAYNFGSCDPDFELCVFMEYTLLDLMDPNNTKLFVSLVGGSMDVTFSEIDLTPGGVVAGKFSATIAESIDETNTKVVTNGSFNIPIQ